METLWSAQYVAHVRLMGEPCLWCWEILDRARDEVVESSWTDHWMAYASRDEALSAASSRLVRLGRP